MMVLDKNNGRFNFNNIYINCELSISDLKNICFSENNKLIALVENGDWISYRLHLDDDWICILQFYQEKVKWFNIFYNSDSEQLSLITIKKLVEGWGGEKQYDWGSVNLTNDVKADYYSILVRYN